MARISRDRIISFFRLGDNAQTTADKGKALEDLICYIFKKVPGIAVARRNEMNVFATEEIDIAFWNERPRKGFYFLPNVILVECKNWRRAVASSQVAWFDRKLQDRGLDFGFLVAANGITGNKTEISRAHQIIAGAQRDGRRLVILRRSEIEGLATSEALVKLTKEKLCNLAVQGCV